MQFKRFVSGVCAASIAVTQTAVVPLSVSATEYKYNPIPNFTDQFTLSLGVKTTTGTYEWKHDGWDGVEKIAPSAGKAVLNGETIGETSTPDAANDVQFTLSCAIDEGYYEPRDEFDFTIYGLTVTLTKAPDDMVEASEESVSSGGRPTADTPITVGAYSKAVKGSTIKVTYSSDTPADEESEVDPALDITDANGSSIANVSFDKDNTVFEITLNENTAASVAENGFKVAGKDITVTDVSVSVPAHSASGAEAQTEILASNIDFPYQIDRDGGGWFNGGIDFHPNDITFSDLKDFIDNGTLTAEWTDVKCTAARRMYFDSINTELWSGDIKWGKWTGGIIEFPRFDLAEKNSRITVEYTINEPTDDSELDENGNWLPMIKFYDKTTGGWEPLHGIHPDEAEDGGILLDKDSSSVTVVLTEQAAQALHNGAMLIQGAFLNVKSVTSLEADPNQPTTIALNETNFPNQTFREYIAENCDKNNDGTLSSIELGKIRSINFDGENIDEKYRKIDDFTGIGYLYNLEELNICGNSAVKTIDVSNCSKLECLKAGNCINLANAVLPDGIKEIALFNTSIKEISTEKFKSLEKLMVSTSKIKGLDLSKNTNLKELNISNTTLENGIDISNCPNLVALSANSCGLKKLDVSKNTKLQNLEVSGNLLVALDLTGLDSLKEFTTDYQVHEIELINNTFNLADLSAYGLDPGKVTLEADNTATRNGNVITFPEDVYSATYTYDTGINDKPLTVQLIVAKRITSNFTVSYMDGDKPMTVAADKWEDVLKVMNNKDIDYVVYLNNDVEVAKLTFPTAAKAKSIAVYSTSAKTITTDAASVTLPINTTFGNISIESTAKTFTITASKNLDLDDFHSEKLKTLKGGARSVLTFNEGADNTIKADISGFGTILVNKCSDAELLGTVKAATLKLNDSANVVVKNNSVTFTNIEIAGETASICYSTDNFKPIAVTGNITAANSANRLYIYQRDEDEQNVSFSAEQTVLTAKTASFANVEVYEDSMPEGEINYTLARVGSDIKLLAEKLKVETFFDGGMNETIYAQWSDVLSTIAANAKAGQNDNEYHVILLDDYDMNGAFKMPAAKTYSSIRFSSEKSVKTITFTGNITLTGFTVFNNIKLDAQKKVRNELQSVEFTIAAGKNALQLEYVNANIKSITSSDEVELTGVTVGAVTANSVKVWANNNNGLIGYSAKGAAWDGKAAPTTTVKITGNLTAKTLLELKNSSSISVGGILNAGKIYAGEDTVLVVKQQAKGKNALVVGKNGFDNGSEKIKFVLVNPATGLTAEITEDLILGTIAGPYTDQLVPSNDNLTEADSYYIVKDGKNLIAKSKEAAKDYITVYINGNPARYRNLDEAIKDINATGNSDLFISIPVTQDMFKAPIAKLPLPSAGKYGMLGYTASSSNVTIDVTNDLALTGDLFIGDGVNINKVKVTGKGDSAKTEVVPLSVNVGKYSLTLSGMISEKTIEHDDYISYTSQFANINGTGVLRLDEATVSVSGKVNGITLVINDCDITLDGAKASFTGSIQANDGELAYDKSITKNVKFKDISGSLDLVIKNGENAVAVNENDIIASVTGDYNGGRVTVNDSELVIVRSGNNLKAVKSENAVGVIGYSLNSGSVTRMYDSLSSTMNDISRIKDKDMNYEVPVKDNDVLVLPKANTYGAIYLKSETAVVITTAKDLTLTGNLSVGSNITVNKADGKAMSVNLGSYKLLVDSDAHIAYDAENKVSRFVNISGKGNFFADENITVSGKVNVGEFSVLKTTLGERSSFSAALINAYEGDELNYPVTIAKNVKFGGFFGETLTVNVSGLEKPNTQIATLTGDYTYGSVEINGEDEFAAVRSGNKLVAVDKKSINYVEVDDFNSNTTRAYDSIASAITDITRLNDAKAEYTIYLNSGDYVIPKLTLPAKGKCASIRFSTTTSNPVNITVSSDITLTCALTLRGNIVLKKAATKTNQEPELKFTSPKNKDGTPTYRVYVDVDATIINGTLNGEPITATTP